MLSSDEDGLSPLMSTRPGKKNETTYKTPIPVTKKDFNSKLSLKKKEKQKENLDPLKTPGPESRKVTASFIFSSCKKKKQVEENVLLPGHTILVEDSSDEEFVNDDPFESCITHQNSEVINDSLVEYSLIRKWLQNAEDSISSDDEIISGPSNSLLDVLDDKKWQGKNSTSLKVISSKSHSKSVENTIILSSDDDESPALKRNFSLKSESSRMFLEHEIVKESSLSEDSFDSSFALRSLSERLVMKNVISDSEDDDSSRNSRQPAKVSDSEEEDSLRVIKPPTKGRKLISDSSSEDEDPSKHRRMPTTGPTKWAYLISDSSSEEDDPLNHQRKTTTQLYNTVFTQQVAKPQEDSDLEDIFVNLAINEVPVVKPKKIAQPRQLKKKQQASEIDRKPFETRRCSFLSSLSVNMPDDRRHPEAMPYIKTFRKYRDELTQRLFVLFNEKVFQNRLPRDFPITWNNRLTRTAGYCRHFTRRGPNSTIFESKIELSVKVVTTPCRLRDTLIHELCHASTWMIDNCRGGHGPVWRKWANLALHVFPELPPISRCHNYEISYKFYYNCSICSFSTGRHSKSVDTSTHVCPMCKGKLQLSSAGKTKEAVPSSTTKTPRTPNVFALFVKEHYSKIKSSRAQVTHAEVMKLLSAKFAESKKQNL
nr:EOG090X0464 [Eurycercus lamellatus]